MASSEFVDPYLDPETGILRNKVGARTKVALDKAEGDLTFARLMQFMDHPPPATGDLVELRTVDGVTNDHACRTVSDRRDFGPLREMFDQVVTKAPADARDDAWGTAERARLLEAVE